MVLGVGVLGAVFAVWFAIARNVLGMQKFQRASRIIARGSRALPLVSITIARVLTLDEHSVIVSIEILTISSFASTLRRPQLAR